MERTAWTEERLDDLADAIRAGFARNDADHREMRADINSVRRTIMTFGGGIIVTLIGVIAAVLAQGA